MPANRRQSIQDFEQRLGSDKLKNIAIYCEFVQCIRSHNGALLTKKARIHQCLSTPRGEFLPGRVRICRQGSKALDGKILRRPVIDRPFCIFGGKAGAPCGDLIRWLLVNGNRVP